MSLTTDSQCCDEPALQQRQQPSSTPEIGGAALPPHRSPRKSPHRFGAAGVKRQVRYTGPESL